MSVAVTVMTEEGTVLLRQKSLIQTGQYSGLPDSLHLLKQFKHGSQETASKINSRCRRPQGPETMALVREWLKC